MFPIGIKIKKYYDKINVISQLQTNIEKEINLFYNIIPLKKEPFDQNKSKNKKNKKNKTKKVKK
jgi:hypothetical protein